MTIEQIEALERYRAARPLGANAPAAEVNHLAAELLVDMGIVFNILSPTTSDRLRSELVVQIAVVFGRVFD